MRHQFYADSRDVLKWSALVSEALRQDLREILQITMLCKDVNSTHGRTTHLPKFRLDPMAEFFEEERRHITTSPQSRDVRRVTRLASLWSPPKFEIQVIDEPFCHKERRSYFERVAGVLRARQAPLVAFLDPDNGIAGKGVASEHVTVQEARVVYDAMSSESSLVIYQHQFREKGWMESRRRTLSESIARPVEVLVAERDVAFLCAPSRTCSSRRVRGICGLRSRRIADLWPGSSSDKHTALHQSRQKGADILFVESVADLNIPRTHPVASLVLLDE